HPGVGRRWTWCAEFARVGIEPCERLYRIVVVRDQRAVLFRQGFNPGLDRRAHERFQRVKALSFRLQFFQFPRPQFSQFLPLLLLGEALLLFTSTLFSLGLRADTVFSRFLAQAFDVLTHIGGEAVQVCALVGVLHLWRVRRGLHVVRLLSHYGYAPGVGGKRKAPRRARKLA